MLPKIKILICYLLLLPLIYGSCSVSGGKINDTDKDVITTKADTQKDDDAERTLIVGAAQLESWLPKIQNSNVALVVNHTSRVGANHLVDTLLQRGVTISRIFAPEHGFRGEADAGQQIADGKDINTGIEVISLYGKKKKPYVDDLKDTDWLVFDIQDVGARFYTYISTMHYVMEACAENNVKMLVLDRPNPNGHYIDGPVLQAAYKSYVGMHPVPVVHGMTIAEYALMINGEGWLEGGQKCELEYVLCKNYDHNTSYSLPIKPSPNLPNMRAIYLYPSLCFFEGTVVSVGRGTDTQFQVYGHPDATIGDYTFSPQPMPGASRPKLEGRLCRGFDLTHKSDEAVRAEGQLNLSYLIDMYAAFQDDNEFFLKNNFFDKLAGTSKLRQQIENRLTEAEIRNSWKEDLDAFKQIRQRYLLYEDFE